MSDESNKQPTTITAKLAKLAIGLAIYCVPSGPLLAFAQKHPALETVWQIFYAPLIAVVWVMAQLGFDLPLLCFALYAHICGARVVMP